MRINGLHLTQIGNGAFLLEPSLGLNIHDSDNLIEKISCRLQSARANRLYYDLSELMLIDPVYYDWLSTLARTVQTLNVTMVCIHMQPTAAFGMSQFLVETPVFECAQNIAGLKQIAD